ncbi:dTDP-4-keto-6-deoxy-D-glucose epimerase, partial [Nitrospirales bacterium NOB]|nr:dTDP-4-keto-6-deoxy-D-glucose epimerase [Nitrospirales bacterium NOB]
MQITSTPLPGLVQIEPDVFRDPRGRFVELYRQPRYEAAGIDRPFVQDNFSWSVRGTLRG